MSKNTKDDFKKHFYENPFKLNKIGEKAPYIGSVEQKSNFDDSKKFGEFVSGVSKKGSNNCYFIKDKVLLTKKDYPEDLISQNESNYEEIQKSFYIKLEDRIVEIVEKKLVLRKNLNHSNINDNKFNPSNLNNDNGINPFAKTEGNNTYNPVNTNGSK